MIIVVAVSLACILFHATMRKVGGQLVGVIHGLIWLIASTIYLYFQDRLISPSFAAVAIISTGIICFSFGCYLGGIYGPQPTESKPPNQSNLQLLIYVCIAAAGTIALWFRANEILPLGEARNWLQDVRRIINDQGGAGYGYAAYLANFGLAATFLALLRCNGRIAWLIASLSLVFSLCSMILLTGRTFIILLFVLVAVAMVCRSRNGVPKVYWVGALALCSITALLLAAITIGQDREDMRNASLLAGLEAHILHYIPSAMAAFSIQVQNAEALTYGQFSFRTVFAVLSKTGFDVEVISLVRPNVEVPFRTNVYTFFSPYYSDFGWLGVSIASLLMGTLTGFTAKLRPTSSHPVIAIALAILMYAMILQFFQDQYMSLLSQWIQLIAVVTVLSLSSTWISWIRSRFVTSSL